jgi:hypothetical protein
LSEEIALIIAEETWEQQGDIRDVIGLSKLVKKHDGPGDIAEIIKTLAKYGDGRCCLSYLRHIFNNDRLIDFDNHA